MPKSVKLSDIAKEFGVSNVTVSKALSGQKGVSEEMREKIVNLANQLGYKQPSAVKKQNQDKGYNIGVLVNEVFFDKYDSFYLNLYNKTSAQASNTGNFTLLETLSQEMLSNNILPNIIRENKVDGIIVIGRLPYTFLEFLKENSKIPMVYLDFNNNNVGVESVISDSYYGGYTMTKYLLEHGHRDIAFVGTILSTSSITDRYLGYVKALMEYGVEKRDEWKIDDRDLKTETMYTTDELTLPEKMPSAFFCNCDLVASRLINKLQSNGYRVPEDVSVVGYDNYLYPGLCNVEITTYEVDVKEMARRAINLLIKKINGTPVKAGLHIVEGHLVEKASVKSI